MTRSLALQRELGPVFDVTLDCEDGAPIGGEAEHAHLVAEMATSSANAFGRCGVRVHPVGDVTFDSDVSIIVGGAAKRLAYIMLPKVAGVADIDRAAATIDASGGSAIPLHALIETHDGLRAVAAIAAHPRIESLSFGLMDFVSAHRGAIPASAMSAEGQFAHPLVVRAKLEVAAACHAFGRTPSHSVVTEFGDAAVVAAAARRAAREFAYTRMWSIHPGQIRPIVAAFAPDPGEIDEAVAVLQAAADAGWAPVRRGDVLHDRASYRYWWRIAERAMRTGTTLPEAFRRQFSRPGR
ncbi:MAG TPA: aldolase/citrate lyase family protein, partial [Caldimonas sp.]|nr:aldolase/citrate lyase family protein [Caldimonas sp.]